MNQDNRQTKSNKPMTTVSVLYFSGSGHTAKMAEAVAKGAAASGVHTNLLPIRGEDIHQGRYQNDALMAQLDASDAIIFGSPTYMGGPAAQFKAFADATGERWYQRKWADKLAAGFTVSGGPSGDKLSTLQYFFTLAMQHGMVWAGLSDLPGANGVNRLSSYAGAMGQAAQEQPDVAPNAADRLTGESLGRRVAEAAKRWDRVLPGTPEARAWASSSAQETAAAPA
jgi:NAD(P)H dehydrogenase (quinone)